MHIYQLQRWKSSHDFEVDYSFGERRSQIVLLLTSVTMVVEIVAGTVFGSMALLADGWHMVTHAAAFGITLFAYWYARRHKDNPEFSFSTGKVSVLGGFASAVALAVVALMLAIESVERMFSPLTIMFNEAIIVATFGLIINGISALILHRGHDYDHHKGQDHNLRAAYFHVLADALTSILAITALIVGKYFGLVWLDPWMGVVGAIIITKWATELLRGSSRILLDRGIDTELRTQIISVIENDRDNRVVDLHTWHVSPHHMALVVSIVTHYPKDPTYYKNLLSELGGFSHITIEVNTCEGPPCIPIEDSAT